MRSAQDALASSGNRQRSIPESRQEAEPLFKRLPYPVKHPDEQPVSMGLTPWNLKFAAEAWIRLSVSFYGLVEGASYHVDVSVADQGILLEDQRIVFVPKAVSDTTVINIPPLNKTGNFVLQVSLVDRFPGLDVDLALIATSGRHMEVWSEGCGARLMLRGKLRMGEQTLAARWRPTWMARHATGGTTASVRGGRAAQTQGTPTKGRNTRTPLAIALQRQPSTPRSHVPRTRPHQ